MARRLLVAKLLTQNEITALLTPKPNETGAEKVDRMIRAYNSVSEHLMARGTLTKDEEETYYWIEEKLAKWKD
jgi:hypothetical protein